MEAIMKQIKDPELLSQIEQVVSFHGFLTSGALIDIQMLNIAKRDLDVQDGERILNTEKLPHTEVIPILLDAEEKVYSWKSVDVEVLIRKKANSVL